jgi:hypothetical protein
MATTGAGGAIGTGGGNGGLTTTGIWIGVSEAKEGREMGVVTETTSEISEGARFFFHAAHPRIAPKSTTVPIKNFLTGDT